MLILAFQPLGLYDAVSVDLSINPDHPPTTANQPWNEHCVLNPCYGRNVAMSQPTYLAVSVRSYLHTA
jgi:hypothetical protein